MGLSVGTLLTTALSAGLKVFGAISAASSAKSQSAAADAAARQAEIEAKERAAAEERENKKLKARQLVGFLRSGVQLEGTPLEVLEETELLGEQDIAAIERAGAAQAAGYRSKASTLKSTARSQLLSGLVGAGSAFADIF